MERGDVFLLRLYVPMRDLDSIKLIGSNAPEENFLAACGRIEIPLSLSQNDRDRHWPIIFSNQQDGLCLLHAHAVFLVSFFNKFLGTDLVADRVRGRHKIFSLRAEDLEQSRHVKALCRFDQCVSGELWSRK